MQISGHWCDSWKEIQPHILSFLSNSKCSMDRPILAICTFVIRYAIILSFNQASPWHLSYSVIAEKERQMLCNWARYCWYILRSNFDLIFVLNLFLICFCRWYKLCNKANKGKKETKERGELELTIQLKEDFPATFDTLDRSGQRSKAKRSSSLQEKDPVKGTVN